MLERAEPALTEGSHTPGVCPEQNTTMMSLQKAGLVCPFDSISFLSTGTGLRGNSNGSLCSRSRDQLALKGSGKTEQNLIVGDKGHI